MKKTDEKKPEADNNDPDELLGDLESIKELLDEEQEARRPAAAEAPDVPLLDDMVEGAYTLDDSDSLLSATPALGGGRRPRTTSAAPSSPNSSTTRPEAEGKYLSEDLFDSLLGDKWKSSASDILTEARGAIEAHRNDWTPEDTDELNAALRVRIDETLTEWLKETVRARMDELHAVLLETAEATIDEKIRALVEARRKEMEDELRNGPRPKPGH
jgi:hypothetical protein